MKLRIAALTAVALLSACGASDAAETPTPAPETQVVEGEGLVSDWGQPVQVGPFELILERPEVYPVRGEDVPEGYIKMVLPVTVTNASDQPASANRLHFSGLSGGQDVVSFMAFEGEPYGPPSSDILPGESVTYDQPIAAVNKDDITLQVDYGEGTLNIEDSVFVGDAAE